MDVMRIIKILRVFNRGFGRVVDRVYLSGRGIYFDGGYVVGRFENVDGLGDLGDKIVELGLKDLEILFEDKVDIRVEGGVTVFDKGIYEVKVGVMESIIEDRVGFNGVKEEGKVVLDLDDIVFSGFNVEDLFGENVLGLIEECLIMNNKAVVINPMWAVIGKIGYSGERIGVSRGLLVIGEELRNMGIKVVVDEDGMILRFGDEGIVRIGKRMMVGKESVDRVLEMIDDWNKKGECVEIIDLNWVKDWERGEGMILYVKDGKIIGVEISGMGINVRGGLFDITGIEKYRIGAKFVKYVIEAEAGILIDGKVLRLRKGNSDLYIAVMKEE